MRQIVLAAGAVALLTACGGSTSPTPTPIAPTPTTPSVPTVARITITGNVPLTQIGQTVQLTAIAALSDNSTKDVTSESNWQWGDARVATVSPRGLVTIVGFGATLISANYQSRGASVTVTATLPDTFVISGRVREPAAGGIANVRVVDTLSGRSGMTDKNGHFSLAELTRLQAHVKAEKDGYEPAELDAI